MDYILSESAEKDLKQIKDYISEDSPINAKNFIDKIFEAFAKIADFPQIGHSRLDLTEKELKFWHIKSYLIVYNIDENDINIVRVLNGYMDITNII